MTLQHRPIRLTVGDVMTTPVLSAGEAATFHEMAGVMARNAISALPIVDENGRVVGVVSEGDLLPKEALPPTRHLWPRHPDRAERAKAEGITAGDVMSSPVVSAAPDETLAIAARRMLDHDVNRLVVLDDAGALAGIISRHDILRAFQRKDEDIRRDIVDGVLPRWMGMKPDTVDITVTGGVVLLRGGLERRSEVTTLGHLCAGLDGVVAVENDLQWTMDDSRPIPAAEAHVRGQW
jgi:CBS domain-containing protein